MTDFIWPSDLDRAENDELNRVCEYAEELVDELAEERRADEDLRDILDRVKVQRDALAAHVNRIHRLWGNCTGMPGFEECKLLDRAISEAPTTSLARHDLLKQAELLESMAGEHYFLGEDEMKRRASKLRQQAKELTK